MSASRVVLSVLAGASLLGAALAGFQEARESITAAELRGHVRFLAGDELKGRAPGTRGGTIAAEYIASRFIAAGLEPLHGDYFQTVSLTGTILDPTSVSLAFESHDERVPARYPEDAVVWSDARTSGVRVSGELVFVGFGIDAPEWGWDDFKGRDLTGKVLLFLVGDPPAPPDEPGLFEGRALTYYGRWTYKLEEARRQGASGALIVHRPAAAGYGWNVVAGSWAGERYSPDWDPEPGSPTPVQGWVTADLARRALQVAGLGFDELVVRAARRDFRPVATGLTVRARLNSRRRSLQAPNVVGYLPGTDPDLRHETLVFTAHYDHLGTGPPVEGDSIYNGAYDNAAGVGILLELAEAFGQLDGTDRGVLFIATTAEESGLLGARHYVTNPVRPLESTVAAINIDGVSLWGETDDVIAPGADYSTLGRVLRARAAEMGIEPRPDPVPEKGIFFRSDHFAFARAGVPALFVQHGVRFRDRPPGWGERVIAGWEREHYHQPSDEVVAGTDLTGAVQLGRLLFGVGYDVANGDERPSWHEQAPYARPSGPSR